METLYGKLLDVMHFLSMACVAAPSEYISAVSLMKVISCLHRNINVQSCYQPQYHSCYQVIHKLFHPLLLNHP